MSKKVSVIMSVYNEREDWLRKSIESILSQTYINIEFIIVLDNPANDQLEQIILEYGKKDERIRFLKNYENIGLVASLNQALEYAVGDYIARMDADDISLPKRLETQVAYIERTGADLVATTMKFIDEADNVIGYSGCYGKTSESCVASLKIRNILPHPTWLYKREMLKVIGNYHQVQNAEYYEWLCRAACAGYKLQCIEDILFSYRIRNNGVCVGKAYQQHQTTDIIRREYLRALKERREFKFIEIAGQIEKIDFSIKNNRYDMSMQIYKQGCVELKSTKKINGIIKIIYAFLICPIHIAHFWGTIKLRRVNS